MNYELNLPLSLAIASPLQHQEIGYGAVFLKLAENNLELYCNAKGCRAVASKIRASSTK
ncbi:hypothetical protein G7B40_034820 [Aetokthonos hydrillicola Thurmond2011]|jgi:ribosome biogenesis protein Tsr3|uniref:Uncharacterized protein n=1 Tax=Aetokthonos hydrillicola Thurmond2011 TaxID=2712845 RepID=A0AAP5IDJ8_9CYAN|nr:hypothetical protein [Aetokthonos hydrillicola]MBW4587055.1 hypothetical protein [Aetokthonos hydrillicola CCALA 1050]MDR9899695.1 hypothetical protein [Aetokthonos hydrillicola Thurmond2011]